LLISALARSASASVMWAAGYDALLETPFFEYFDQRDQLGRSPQSLADPSCYGRNSQKAGICQPFGIMVTQ
jgi:hypothetical protein